jgi:hypothetical protein
LRTTECSQTSFEFATESRQEVVARFDGGTITTDAGGLLLHKVEQKAGILRQFAGCFRDHRDPNRTEHRVGELVRQRVYALALGYEDLNDHDQLRADPLLGLLSGKADVEGKQRRREQDRGKAGAGKSTLNRLELTPADADEKARYKKIVLDTGAVDDLLVDLYIQRQPRQPQRSSFIPPLTLLPRTDELRAEKQDGVTSLRWFFFLGFFAAPPRPTIPPMMRVAMSDLIRVPPRPVSF